MVLHGSSGPAARPYRAAGYADMGNHFKSNPYAARWRRLLIEVIYCMKTVLIVAGILAAVALTFLVFACIVVGGRAERRLCASDWEE